MLLIHVFHSARRVLMITRRKGPFFPCRHRRRRRRREIRVSSGGGGGGGGGGGRFAQMEKLRPFTPTLRLLAARGPLWYRDTLKEPSQVV